MNEEKNKRPKQSHPNITPVEDTGAVVWMPTKKKSVLPRLVLGAVVVAGLGWGGIKAVQGLHIGKTECCDGSWYDSKGSGTCSHHGGIIGVGCRQCKDGSWSTAKGSGACSRHGGLKED